MNKYLAAVFIIGMMQGAPLLAQDDNLKLLEQIDQMGPSPTPAPASGATPAAQQEPTIITASKESIFSGTDKTAVLYGDIKVKNPQFTLSSDKLTVYFHKDDATGAKNPKAGASPAPRPTPLPTPKPDASNPAAGSAGSIDKVIAEGNVVIESDRPDPKGGPPVHYVGKGDKVIYTPATGEAIFIGMPQLQQGINTMVATDSSTWISLDRDGQMHAHGPVKMEVSQPAPDTKTPTPTPDKTPEIE